MTGKKDAQGRRPEACQKARRSRPRFAERNGGPWTIISGSPIGVANWGGGAEDVPQFHSNGPGSLADRVGVIFQRCRRSER